MAQRLMDDGFSGSSDDLKKVATRLGRADMPSSDFKVSLQKASGGVAIEHVTVDGVTFKTALGKGQFVSPENLKAIAHAINENNKLIKDPKLQVHDVAIAGEATTRMSTYGGKPMLVMDPKFATAATASHESGHALFTDLSQTKGQAVATRVADIYNRLMATKPTPGVNVSSDGTKTKTEGPAGMWPFDPPQWNKAASSEHPWDNPDELFGSAMEAYRTDRGAFEKAVEKYAKLDPAGAAPAKELLQLFDDMAAGKTISAPKLSTADAKAAAASLKRDKDLGKVEDTLDSGISPALALALKAKN